MEGKLEDFLTQLETIKTTHPNIYNLWKKYVNEKIKTLEDVIKRGYMMLENSKNVNDLSINDICTAYHLKEEFMCNINLK
tara:strand:- start:82 stop:321 length:240 start_codon:yes stop_codon:yes gene_type:complete